VKTSDEGIEKEYDLPTLPALAFYRNKFRQIYTGTYCAVSRIFVLIDAKYVIIIIIIIIIYLSFQRSIRVDIELVNRLQ